MTNQFHQKNFKRLESKYLVPRQVLPAVMAALEPHMVEDDFTHSTITSLYFDTPSFEMIQDSLAKKHGKEKLRIRTYDPQPTAASPAFLEIKQKIAGVGYKYRVATVPAVAKRLVEGSVVKEVEDERMQSQLELLRERYATIEPKMLIAYKRLSLKGKINPTVRVTFDSDLTYAQVHDVSLTSSAAYPLLDPNQVVMEIKTEDQIPAWLQRILETYHLEKTSFSKYGRAYQLQDLHQEARYA